MKIFIGADHQGFELKNRLFAYLSRNGYEVEDLGPRDLDPEDDYPQYAQRACLKVLGEPGADTRAILICGGGQGMAIAANRFLGIRAVVIRDVEEAKLSRVDNDSNVLSLPAKAFENDQQLFAVVEVWLSTQFSKAPRHARRIRAIDNY